MKIAIIGGLSSYLTIKWANALAEKENNITVYSHAQDNKLEDLLNSDITKQYLSVSYADGGLKKNVKELKSILASENFDVINVIDAVKYGFLALKAAGKYVVTIAGPDIYAAADGTSKSLFVKVVKKASAVIAPSGATIDYIKNNLYKKEQNYFQVAPGIDVDKFNITDCEKYDKVTFGSFKALEPYNNLSFAIDAYAKMCGQVEVDTQFLIYGEGSEKEALVQKVKSMGLDEKVKFMGTISPDKVPEEMNKITALLSSATYDVFGVSTIEGMACGTPSIATDTFGAAEIILNGVTGYTVKAGKLDSYVYRMTEFANYPQNADKMGNDSRPDIVELYEINACTDAYIKALNSAK